MTLAVATIPEDPERLPGWLEEQLVGGRLRDLVAELTAIHPTHPPGGSVRDDLGPRLRAILDGGLFALPPEALRGLLRQPIQLLELQEVVLTEGGPYWDGVPRSRELAARAEAGWRRLSPGLLPADDEGLVTLSSARTGRWYREPWAVAAATAAAVLVAVFAVEGLRDPPRSSRGGVGWGWAKADGLPQAADARGYLNAVADGAGEWFNERPDEPVALARRLSEFRQGCSVLVLADPGALSADQKQWLRERCGRWAKKFDEHLAKLDAGGDTSSVRAEADATVRQLIDALRAEAARV